MENPIVWALIATLGTWAVTARSAATVFLFRRPSPEAMNRMLGFSAGVMIAASFWSLLQPAIARAAEQDGLPPWLVATLGFLLGAVFLWASDRVVTCVSCRSERGNGRTVSFCSSSRSHCTISRRGWLSAWPLGHCSAARRRRAVMGAISIAFGIGLQNFPEGAAVSMPLRREGAGRLRSFLLGQASGLVEPVAGVLGALLVGSAEAILPYALAFAAGAMILVAVHELIPECQRNREARPTQPRWALWPDLRS